MLEPRARERGRAEPTGRRRLAPSQLPDPARTLGWLGLGRALLGAALLPLSLAGGIDPAAAAVLAPLLLLGAAASYLHTRRRGGAPTRPFLFAQVAIDALLLTAVVHSTGGQQSLFAPLYIAVIGAAALLLPVSGAIAAGLLASALYLIGAFQDLAVAPGAVLLQFVLFALVALATGYLGGRLREAGAALGEVETELRRLRLDTSDILTTVSSGVLTVDGDGRLAYLNPAAGEILSLDAADWVGRPILAELDRIAPGLGAVIDRSARERTAIRRFETDALLDDAFVLGVSTTLVDAPDGDRPPVTAIFQDITEKKRVEALRRRAERLEAVAELSASLAHEIRNPLASIRSAVEQVAADSVDPEDALVLKALVLRESDRLSRLLTEFIDFARVKVDAPQPVEFTAVVGHVRDLVRAHPEAAGREIDLRLPGRPGPFRILGAEDLLHRAVLNLVLNGAQWAGEGGRVTLALDEVRSDLLSPALGALRLVRLTVSDTGPGVPDEVVEQIFDPFFTLRPGGTGLGLALVQRAVEAHGGAVFVDNAPAGSGVGALFTLYLPALPETAEGAPTPAEAEEAASL